MTGPTDSDRDAGRALAELLRNWWKLSARDGRPKPTQQSLAGRLGIDQTTLSRYLNPQHPSTAPLKTVELLHTTLRAPDADLARARTLAASAASGPQRAPARLRRATPAPASPYWPSSPSAAASASSPRRAPSSVADGPPSAGRRRAGR
ncbi:hypothetical protein [Streptomyces sirii]|uniref:hypothetical protein n=1 Tax=Streptomyces sirii TaxID=3127701 RepID=UPI003D35D84D